MTQHRRVLHPYTPAGGNHAVAWECELRTQVARELLRPLGPGGCNNVELRGLSVPQPDHADGRLHGPDQPLHSAGEDFAELERPRDT